MIFQDYYDLAEFFYKKDLGYGRKKMRRFRVQERDDLKILKGRVTLSYSTRYNSGEVMLGFGEFIITDVIFDIVKSEIIFNMEIYDSRKHDNLYKTETLFDVIFKRLMANLTLAEKLRIFKTEHPNRMNMLNSLFRKYTFINAWLLNIGAMGNDINFFHCLPTDITASQDMGALSKFDKIIVPTNLSLLSEIQDTLISKIIIDIFDTNVDLLHDPSFDEFLNDYNFDELKTVALAIEEESEDVEEEQEEQEEENDTTN